MKKTFTRALSLILVLVTLIGVMPMALADEFADFGAGDITAAASSATVKAGGSITLTASVPYDSDRFEAPTVEWYPEDVGVGTVVKDATDPFKATFTAGENTGAVMITMVATAKGAQSGTPFDITRQITVTIEAADSEGGETEEHAYAVTVEPAALTLAVGEESEPLDVIVKDGDKTLASDKYTVESFLGGKDADGKEIASVNGDGVIKGVAVGTTKVEVTVTIKETEAEVNGFVDVTVEEAEGGVIECKNAEARTSETYTLKPVLKLNGQEVAAVEFDFVPTNSKTTIAKAADKKSATVSNAKGGPVEITISVDRYKPAGADAYISGDDVEIEPIKVIVSFYKTNNITTTLNSGKSKVTLDQDKVFSEIEINNDVLSSLYNDFSLARIFEYQLDLYEYEAKPATVYFDSVSGSASGQIVDAHGYACTSKAWGFLDQVWFAQTGNRTGSASFNYKIADAEDLTLMTGTITIVIAGGEGDIHYETTYNKSVALKEADFTAFWTEQNMGKQYTLSYVMFDVAGMSGTLKYDTTKQITVTSGMSFYLNPTTTAQYDLSKVYYVPNAKDTSEYIDGFNFKAYGLYNTSASGTVTIGVNTKAATNITSRGVVMSTTHSNAIKEAYKSNTGKDLGYVVFDLPEAKYGKLYKKLPSEVKTVHGTAMNMSYVAQGYSLSLTDKMYYASNKADVNGAYLATVVYVPAAGFKGEVELTYTAYDANGNYAYEGKLRFNVSTKTASGIFSDVTAKSYSWAADSADFLYYEGVAQGSKAAGSTKITYNPAANITRQDFMLMLYRAFLAENYSTFNVTSNFPDVVKGNTTYSQEIYQAVGVAKYLGIAQGSNDKFNPKSNITRQDAMVLIYRTLDVINKNLDYTVTANVASFKDANKISGYATASITYLVNHGVIQGSNDKINPTANITRAEMACILHRVLTY